MRWTVIPSRSNKLSTANIQINFNTVHSPAHFFSKTARFSYKNLVFLFLTSNKSADVHFCILAMTPVCNPIVFT